MLKILKHLWNPIRNLFFHLGSTCDADFYLKEQSIEDYFDEHNKFYDIEFELIRLLQV